jgi:hypothetical protein
MGFKDSLLIVAVSEFMENLVVAQAPVRISASTVMDPLVAVAVALSAYTDVLPAESASTQTVIIMESRDLPVTLVPVESVSMEKA